MKFDKTHRRWFYATAAITIACSVIYAAYAANTPGGPRGGTWVGLAFGLAGTGMILFAGLLALRKKMLLLRVGSVAWWMRGHVWLGVLALPLILFHSGFALGGTLTTVLMWLMFVVVGTGVFGAMLQHAMPSIVTAQVGEECTYEQITRAQLQLRRDVYELVSAATGPAKGAAHERAELERALGVTFRDRAAAKSVEGGDLLSDVYVRTVLPYLRRSHGTRSPLCDATTSALLFDQLRPQLDPSLHGALDDMASMCSAVRQWSRQIQLHRWLHGWLLVHVPASIALLVLMFVHAVMALYY